MEKICIKTFGCSINTADSERMTKVLHGRGFSTVNSEAEANIIILNTCAVKGPTETSFFKLLDELKIQNKKVIIAGCIAQAMPEKLEEYSKVGPDQIENIADIVDETLAGNTVSMLVQEPVNKAALFPIRSTPFREIIPISQGCLGACSYCITRLARGKLYSYPIEDIVTAVKKAAREGIKEIWLTSQDTGCYGFDCNSNLPALLTQVCTIPGDHYIRVGMMNPNHVIKILDDLITIYKHPRIYKFLHIPIQSASNEVLNAMNRGYTAEDFSNIVKRFKLEIPEITIATDIIVGYPTETDADYEKTILAVRTIQPDIINLSKFWPRPHTKAALLTMLPGDVIKKRSLTMLQHANMAGLTKNQKWLHWKGPVLITEKGKESTFIGRNYAYKQVIIPGESLLAIHNNDISLILGSVVFVHITECTQHDLRAELIDAK